MSMDMETSSSTKPENTSPKKAMGQHAAASGPGPGLPWARELLHRDSWAGPAAQVAAPESRAAAPHSLRACAWALLHLLWCGFLAILSKVLAVIWRCGQQLGLAQGTGSGTAAAAAAAGAESGAAAPHGPSCVPGPSATQEAHGQWAAPRVVLPELQNEEGDISEDVRSSTSGVESYSALLPLLMSTSDTSSTCSSDPKLLELWTGTKTEDRAAVKRR
ncbi:uncharacterized protein LOC111932471 [Cyanistes caeruleus]|uniref:uncharacterized protein LOC111932471 n=1 Tax=Cyanistes caeruleus TaxID=156563 RepID=UPI000CDA024D|nr:uncharacterized protein LOC111932471 [Cyanistes caeruleus]